MERFEIEDIVAQDPRGVVFRARIRSSDTPVAIRRFSPFGEDGGGLDDEEAAAFGIAASRLAKLDHPALRRVIEGSVDPIDGLPYLVSEWIEGESLADVLNGEKLDPALVIDVMRLALEVSLVLSEVLGEEALWVETDPATVLVGDAESGRGFTFWISPFKWLSSDTESRNLLGLVALGEGLAGWSKRLVSDQAGSGLGGWFKWVKANPDAGVRQAMNSLVACTSKSPSTPEEPVAKPAPAQPAPLIKPSSSKAPLLVALVIGLLVLGVALLYLRNSGEAPVLAGDLAKQEAAEVISETDDSVPAAADQVEEVSVDTAEEEPAEEAKPQPEFLSLNPDQLGYMRAQRKGTRVELTGKLRSVASNRSKSLLILKFEGKGGDAPILGVVPRKGFQGPFSVAAFKQYIGKTVVVRGTSNPDRTKKCRDVLVKRFQDISLSQP